MEEELHTVPEAEDPVLVAAKKSREQLELGQRVFTYSRASGASAEALKVALLAEVERDCACFCVC